MAGELIHISLDEFSSNVGDFFARVVREHEPIVVEGEEGELVILKPVRSTTGRRPRRRRTAADHAAFLSSFGSWSDVDIDTFLKDLYESRSISSRPSIEL